MSQWSSAKAKRVLAALLRIGWRVKRESSSHKTLARPNVKEILNLQPKGAKAKSYQVKQVRAVILRYKLAGESDEQ